MPAPAPCTAWVPAIRSAIREHSGPHTSVQPAPSGARPGALSGEHPGPGLRRAPGQRPLPPGQRLRARAAARCSAHAEAPQGLRRAARHRASRRRNAARRPHCHLEGQPRRLLLPGARGRPRGRRCRPRQRRDGGRQAGALPRLHGRTRPDQRRPDVRRANRRSGAAPGHRDVDVPGAPPGFTAEHVHLNRALASAAEQPGPAPRRPDDPIIVAHTSGTTGFPKGVVATARSVVSAVKGHYVDEPLTTRNRTGIAGHFSHLVYQPGLYASLLSNMPVWTMSPHDAPAVLRTIERERINIFFAFPDVFLRMYLEGLDGYDLDSMRIWVATADASHEVHMRAFCGKGGYAHLFGRPLLGSLFIEALGSSEVGSGALRRIRTRFAPGRSDRLLGRPSIGGPRVRVADASGGTCAAGLPGRLLVRGPTVSRAYWGDREAAP